MKVSQHMVKNLLQLRQVHTTQREKEEEQDNADLLCYRLFSKCFFEEPIAPFASFTLLSTRTLGETGAKGKKFKSFFTSLTVAPGGSHCSSELAARGRGRKQSKKWRSRRSSCSPATRQRCSTCVATEVVEIGEPPSLCR